ncbi:MAG: DUF3048 domain-containing protein [Patescibacteria group bacterium]|nr:DUF3048 domain-containing protein [Patescibacteria group bacterium]
MAEEKVRAPLSGIFITKDKAKKRPLAIVVENHPEARPQSGLDKASLVFETYAEGGITRLLAVFQENEANEIGPVRSARTAFDHWANEFKAVYGHVGGGEAALNLIDELHLLDLNQFYNGNSYWRDESRYAPHNVYTTTAKIRAGGLARGYSKETDIESFKFKDDLEKSKRPESFEFTVPFSGPTYNIKYIYDKETNSFLRYLAGSPHRDKITGKNLKAKNVIVMYAGVLEGSGGTDTQVQVVGSGEAEFYIDGEKILGTWEKATSASRTKFLDANGVEIVLNAGTTWIEVEKE